MTRATIGGIIGVSNSVPDAQLTPFDLDAFVAHAEALNQRHRDAFTTPFPKDPSRWLSHYHFTPQPLAFTQEGDVDGGLSWLVGATIDFSFTRVICAPNYGTRGGPCYDPASLVFLEAAFAGARRRGRPGARRLHPSSHCWRGQGGVSGANVLM